MLPEDLKETNSKIIDLPSGCKIVSLEDARLTLQENINYVFTLQAYQDDVEDLTEVMTLIEQLKPTLKQIRLELSGVEVNELNH